MTYLSNDNSYVGFNVQEKSFHTYICEIYLETDQPDEECRNICGTTTSRGRDHDHDCQHHGSTQHCSLCAFMVWRQTRFNLLLHDHVMLVFLLRRKSSGGSESVWSEYWSSLSCPMMTQCALIFCDRWCWTWMFAGLPTISLQIVFPDYITCTSQKGWPRVFIHSVGSVCAPDLLLWSPNKSWTTCRCIHWS